MPIRQQLTEEMKNAMRAKDQMRLDTVRFVLSQMKNAEIDLHREMNDDEIITLMKKEVKNRKDATDQFRQAGRNDLVTAEEQKLSIIQKFLPEQMSDEELSGIVEKVVSENDGANFGQIMQKVMTEVKGKADGGRVSGMVRGRLG